MLKNVQDYHYILPEELIADKPAARRENSKMLVVNRQQQTITHSYFRHISEFLTPDDLLILNNTKVIPARFLPTVGCKEIVITNVINETKWQCLVRPGKKMQIGSKLQLADTVGEVIAITAEGERIIQWQQVIDIEKHGQLALPHYMQRAANQTDKERYQTVYASQAGAIAAPTAGLHFTQKILQQFNHDFLTLHVGVGTFRPIKGDDINKHQMHKERYSIGAETYQKIINHRQQNQRIVAVGTTTVRVLEHLVQQNNPSHHLDGSTDIFIHPPYQIQSIDCLLTNFHLPKSTLLMLVSAFAGFELIQQAYQEAIANRYQFYSYGDCMLII